MSFLPLEEIALIGAGVLLPGGIEDLDALWRFLLEGGEASGPIPPDRWSWKRFYSPDPSAPGKTTMMRGNFLKRETAAFDPLFFSISPREAVLLDALQRQALETAWHAFEDSGIAPAQLRGSRTGVFMGAFAQDFFAHSTGALMRPQITDHYSATAATATMVAARIAYTFDLRGPAMTIDTACSSSMVALHQACLALQTGACDLALAGGANFMLKPETAMSMSKGRYLSEDGRSKSFSAQADGYGRGEGGAVVVLKRLSDARRDGDRVRAVISATGLNQDGRTPAVSLPSASAQEELLREVLVKAGVEQGEIAYVEAHGAGTPVGDPIEAQAISSALYKEGAHELLPIGSIKANLGHLEATAGIAGLLKAVLCLEHGVAPPQPGFVATKASNFPEPLELSREIPWEENGLILPRENALALAPDRSGVLRAVVNSFGYGGTNGVALLRAPTEAERQGGKGQSGEKSFYAETSARSGLGFLGRQPLFLSAFTPKALEALAARYVGWLSGAWLSGADEGGEEGAGRSLSPADLCFSAVETRARFRYRAVILPAEDATSQKGSAAYLPGLRALASGNAHEELIRGEARLSEDDAPVFVFGGMGAQWEGMGAFLLENAPPETARKLRAFEDAFEALSGWSIRNALRTLARDGQVAGEEGLQAARIVQPLLFWTEMGLASCLEAYGVKPGAVIGHSTGELAAAWSAGALESSEAATIVYHHGRLQAQLEGRGGLLVVRADEETARRLNNLNNSRAAPENPLALAAVNGPDAVIFSGPTLALEELALRCRKEGVASVALNVNVPFHSPVMDEIEAPFVDALSGIGLTPKIPFYSTVLGARLKPGTVLDGAYWHSNTRQTVRFQEAVRAALAEGRKTFLELSPAPVLLGAVRAQAALEGRDVTAIAVQRRRQSACGAEDFARALAALAVAGGELDWEAVFSKEVCRKIDLPLTPWVNGTVPWLECPASVKDRLDRTVHPVLGTPSSSPGHSWSADLTTGFMPWLPDHRLTFPLSAGPPAARSTAGLSEASLTESTALFPASAVVEGGIALHWEHEGKAPVILESVRLVAPLAVPESQTGRIVWRFDPRTREATLESETSESAADWRLHARMRILESKPWRALPAPRGLPWGGAGDASLETLWREIPTETLYEKFAQRGFAYGSAFQTVRRLWRNGQGVGAQAAAEIGLERRDRAESAAYFLHPALLDGAFQLLGALVSEEEISDADALYAPCAIKRVIWHGQGARGAFRLRACAELVAMSAQEIVGDVRLYDEGGACLAEIIELACRALPTREATPELFYGESWVALPALGFLAEPRRLVFAGTLGKSFQDALCKTLEENGAQIAFFPNGTAAAEAFRLKKYSSKATNGRETPPCGTLSCETIVWFPTGDIEAALTELGELIRALAALSSERTPTLLVVAAGLFWPENAGDLGDSASLVDERMLKRAAIAGFVRSARREYPSLTLGMIGLPEKDPQKNMEEGALIERLAAEIAAQSEEDEVFLSADGLSDAPSDGASARPSGGRWGARLAPLPSKPQWRASAWSPDDPRQAIELMRNADGRTGISGLAWRKGALEAPGPGQIAVKTLEASLNFKDLLKVMDLLPDSVTEGTHHGQALGTEAVVEVTEVGRGVAQIRRGQKFLACLPGAFVSHRLIDVEGAALVPLPEGTAEGGLAGFPVAALTAWHGLVTLARLEEGESVLVHAAAGGVGQMAVQIAKLRGARIFATAGSEEKRQYLRDQGCEGVWDTRTLAFADGVLAATGGAGVDVVLNSLPGEAMAASLRITAPFGRFVEIGKRDIIEEGQLDLQPFNENLSYFSFDLDRLMKARPKIVSRELRDLIARAQEGALRPPPYTAFPAGEVEEAFRYLASSRHIGKVLLRFEELERITALAEPPVFAPIKADGAYLVTGGARGFGLETVRWLLAQGAGRVHLMSRTPPDAETLAGLHAEAASLGAGVQVHLGDVADAGVVKQIVEKCSETLPLKGIFHAAGVLEDGLLENEAEDNAEAQAAGLATDQAAREKRARVLAPKINGALALHTASLETGAPLEHFVLYSSLVAKLGNPGQTAYGAANAFLDALAAARRARNLPGLSVGWGAIAEGGMLAGNAPLERLFARAGITPLSAATALKALPALGSSGESWAACCDVDWAAWRLSSPRLSCLPTRKAETAQGLAAFLALPEGSREAFVLTCLREELGKVLQISPEGISSETRLSGLGVDSLAGLELQLALRARLGVELPLALLARSETAGALARGLARHAASHAPRATTTTVSEAETSDPAGDFS